MASLTKTPHNYIHSSINVKVPTLKIRSAISIPKLPNHGKRLLKDLNFSKTLFKNTTRTTTVPVEKPIIRKDQKFDDDNHVVINTNISAKLYIILEAVLDRIEMHHNIMEQRSNWNSLLLNSLNMITLTAATMAGLSGSEIPILPLKVSSILLFSAATGGIIGNEQDPTFPARGGAKKRGEVVQPASKPYRNVSFSRNAYETHVYDAMEKVLALDRAYPLPLLGAMIDKFPKTFKPASWWPTKIKSSPHIKREKVNNNGWSEELEEEMREIVGVINNKDIEDYVRLGNKALKLNKLLAILGPLLMGTAAVGSAFMGHGGPWAGLVATVAGSMASVVNTIEHGGQVGMVYEMYRNCAGFFSLLEETVESTLEEVDFGRRENGELFELKMALHLGRSLSELRDLADESRINGGSVNGFASKLF